LHFSGGVSIQEMIDVRMWTIWEVGGGLSFVRLPQQSRSAATDVSFCHSFVCCSSRS
jgi:hypothetical protein